MLLMSGGRRRAKESCVAFLLHHMKAGDPRVSCLHVWDYPFIMLGNQVTKAGKAMRRAMPTA